MARGLQRCGLLDLEVRHQDQRTLEHRRHCLLIGHHVVREVSAVERHPLDDVQRGFRGQSELRGDHPRIADHRVGLVDKRAELRIGRGDIGDRRQNRLVGGRPRRRLDVSERLGDGEVDAPAKVDRLRPAPERRGAALHERVGENDRCGRSVAGHFVGLHGHFAHDLRAHVFEALGQLNLGRDRQAIAGDDRRPDRPVDHGVHALGTERRFDRRGEPRHAAGKRLARGQIVKHEFGHDVSLAAREAVSSLGVLDSLDQRRGRAEAPAQRAASTSMNSARVSSASGVAFSR
jgi:hypothetical protein